jgi:hypothetical protein
MDIFEELLFNINHDCAEEFINLPFDIQEIIYNNIRNDLLKENTTRHRHRLTKELKNTVKPLNITEYGGFLGGAWEYLFTNKNRWVDIYSKASLEQSLGWSALQFCRNEFILNPL